MPSQNTADLFERLQDFLALTKMSKEQLESTVDQLWVVVHDQ